MAFSLESLAPAVRERRILAWLAGAGVWLAWFISLAVGGWTRDATGHPLGADHVQYYVVGELVREGQAGRIYDQDTMKARQAEVGGPGWEGWLPFRYPPFYALVSTPWSSPRLRGCPTRRAGGSGRPWGWRPCWPRAGCWATRAPPHKPEAGARGQQHKPEAPARGRQHKPEARARGLQYKPEAPARRTASSSNHPPRSRFGLVKSPLARASGLFSRRPETGPG
jgi:hypothetical protein